MSSYVEVYIDEHGRPEAAWVTLDVNGEPLTIEFYSESIKFFALFPEDADTVNDQHTEIDHVLLPTKPSREREAVDE